MEHICLINRRLLQIFLFSSIHPQATQPFVTYFCGEAWQSQLCKENTLFIHECTFWNKESARKTCSQILKGDMSLQYKLSLCFRTNVTPWCLATTIGTCFCVCTRYFVSVWLACMSEPLLLLLRRPRCGRGARSPRLLRCASSLRVSWYGCGSEAWFLDNTCVQKVAVNVLRICFLHCYEMIILPDPNQLAFLCCVMLKILL